MALPAPSHQNYHPLYRHYLAFYYSYFRRRTAAPLHIFHAHSHLVPQRPSPPRPRTPLSRIGKAGPTSFRSTASTPGTLAKRPSAFQKQEPYRAQFLIETVADLRKQLQQKGSDLIIRQGKPEEEIPQLVEALKIDAVYWHEEVTSEETEVERAVENSAGKTKGKF